MREYRRKSKRKICTEEMLVDARDKLKNGHSKRQIAKYLGISEAALRNRLKKGFGVKKLGRFDKTFSIERELELAEHCLHLDEYFYGVTFRDLRRLAYDYADHNKIPNDFDVNTKMAGKDWAYSFMKRHKLTLRTPQKTSLARIMGFNEKQVNIFFTNLSALITRHNFPPHRIFNMDETGLTTVANKVPKVVSKRGKRCVGKVVSAERGQLVTAVCCMSAGGSYVPPAVIFPRKRLKEELLNGAPPGTTMLCSDSGYINSELFVEWLKHFQKHVLASKENPALLILDNHFSHLSLNAILYCREHCIRVLSIPPHSSHKIQPLDRCFFKALKDLYSQASDQWLLNNPGRCITQFQIVELFGIAYNRYATVNKSIQAFKVCGIYPLNSHIFTEEDFLPSSVTDQFVHEHSSPSEITTCDISPSCSNIGVASSSTSTSSTTAEKPSCSIRSAVVVKSPNQNCCSGPRTDVSLQDILPLPRRKEKQNRRKKGKKSEIVSGTPFKEELEAKTEEKTSDSGKLTTINNRITKKRLFETTTAEKCLSKKVKSKSTEEILRTDTFCTACEEQYRDPPSEDWIQCSMCMEWWHESCSNYENIGNFVCDYC